MLITRALPGEPATANAHNRDGEEGAVHFAVHLEGEGLERPPPRWAGIGLGAAHHSLAYYSVLTLQSACHLLSSVCVFGDPQRLTLRCLTGQTLASGVERGQVGMCVSAAVVLLH